MSEVSALITRSELLDLLLDERTAATLRAQERRGDPYYEGYLDALDHAIKVVRNGHR